MRTFLEGFTNHWRVRMNLFDVLYDRGGLRQECAVIQFENGDLPDRVLFQEVRRLLFLCQQIDFDPLDLDSLLREVNCHTASTRRRFGSEQLHWRSSCSFVSETRCN